MENQTQIPKEPNAGCLQIVIFIIALASIAICVGALI
jgi:hypothetical protein